MEVPSDDPINAAIEVLGDRWTLLVLRDVIFDDRRYFRALLTGSTEGIASNILADRLKRLLDAGILSRGGAVVRGQRARFSLTEAGIQTVPIICALGDWGLAWRDGGDELRTRQQQLMRDPTFVAELMDDLRARHLDAPPSTDAGPGVVDRRDTALPAASDPTPMDVARRIIDAHSYATLATADAGGRPWATPVWFAERDLREFVWVSRPERRHSQNVAERAEIALVVFDSTAPVGSSNAVYVEAVAAQVTDAELADALSVFNAKSEAAGLPAWDDAKMSGRAPFRLYRALSSRVWVLDEHENRVPVSESD